MIKERYYYAVAAFLRKDGKLAYTSVTSSVKGEEEDIKFYPLMNTSSLTSKSDSRMIWFVVQLSYMALLRLVKRTMKPITNA